MAKVQRLSLLAAAGTIALAGILMATSTLFGSSQGGRTVTVGASGCDYTTIQAAIDAVPDGSTIQITAGTYQETVAIRNRDGLVLHGAGTDSVTLDGNGAQQRDAAPGVLVRESRNITISGLRVTNSWRGLEADDSSPLVVVGSSFEANLEIGVYLLRSEAEIRDSTVRSTQSDYDGKRGDGIFLEDASGTISSCTVADNSRVGIFAVLNSRATIDDNTISGNHNGVAIRDTSEATVTRNRITGAKYYGIQVYVAGKATIKNNTFAEHGDQGIRIGATGTSDETVIAEVSGNTVERCRGVGLFADGDPGIKLSVKSCALSQNGGGGIDVHGTSDVTITQCTISGNAVFGIQAFDAIGATITDSRITATKADANAKWGDGILISGRGQASIRNCTITDSAYMGIRVQGTSSATIEGNSVNKNAYHGIVIWESAEATITSNQVAGNTYYGIQVNRQSKTTIRNNTITDSGDQGIRVGATGAKDESLRTEISGNTVLRSKGCGVFADSDTGIVITGQGNKISGDAGEQLCGATSKFPKGFGGGK